MLSVLPLTAHSMALPWVIGLLLVFTVTCSQFQSSTCSVVKGSVSCLDCAQHQHLSGSLQHLSGIVVSIKCDQVKQSAIAKTEKNGSFEKELPLHDASSNCFASILGGPQQLCTFKRNLISKVVKKVQDPNSYTISTPLAFYTSCPSKNNVPASPADSKSGGSTSPVLGSSKTYDIPLPPEWGLAPSSFYVPIIPIGIP